MKLAVIIPVGPGHQRFAEQAVRSARVAWRTSQGPFTELQIGVIPDLTGKLGRSRARNIGLDRYRADWHFLLDADDQMLPGALPLVDLEQPATFGAVFLQHRGRLAVYKCNRYPVTRDTILEHGPHGTLTMGCFLRGDLGLRFDESIDVAEDFDFYLRLPGFTKRREALVCIGYDLPSAGGPRSSQDCAWLGACAGVIERYREREKVIA